MKDILEWNEIEQLYDQNWVQLVDFEWLEGEPRPRRGRVRISASTRKEFNKRVLEAEPVDAARVFVGKNRLPENTIFSANAVKIDITPLS